MMGATSGKRLLMVLVIISIFLVSSLGYLYFSGTDMIERNLVGVISVEGAIISSETSGKLSSAINRAMLNKSVKAVVLRIDSPGGYAHLIEQIYLDVLKLKEQKPVVASVATALSGGYYLAVAADYVYAHPTSMVGNVGVIGVGPATLIPSETVMETGPYKATGFSKILFPFNLTHALDNFVAAVENGRGNHLRLSTKELRRGMIYMGSEAVVAGLVDEVGSLQKAAERAAEEADLIEYKVGDISQGKSIEELFKTKGNETGKEWRDITVETLNQLNPPPAIYYLYIPPKASMENLASLAQMSEETGDQTTSGAYSGGVVLVDLSHGNRVSMWVMDIIAAELAIRGITLGFAATWDEIEEALDSASGLIIAAPTEAYSSDEGKKIEKFVGNGRMLLLIFDPASEYIEVPALLGPINSIANRFGLSFAKGYLYNEEEHYGFYRNIYLRQFSETSITSNLDTLVLFTATHVKSMGHEAAWASSDTYSSTAERMDDYVPIALLELNGTIAAFGDLTFLMEPYCYIEDNYKLILNLVSALSDIEVLPPKDEIEYNVTMPDLPVGTEKIFTEQVDGEEHDLRWYRVSENETVIERPDRTTHYYYDTNGSLLWWESNGMKAVYDRPLPDLPYPLIEGKAWAYASRYNLTIEKNEFSGQLRGNGWVEKFQTIEAGDGESYLCVKVREIERDHFMMEGTNVTMVISGYSWISTKAGLIKGEILTRYYMDGIQTQEESRKLLLTSITKGED